MLHAGVSGSQPQYARWRAYSHFISSHQREAAICMLVCVLWQWNSLYARWHAYFRPLSTIDRSRMSIKTALLPSAITAHSHVTTVICRLPDKSRTACLTEHMQTHSKIKWSCFHRKWWNILLKLDGSVDVTSTKVFVKFGYDQSNISYRKASLKNISNYACNYASN